MLKQARMLPDEREFRKKARELEDAISEVSLRQLLLEEEQRSIRNTDGYLDEYLTRTDPEEAAGIRSDLEVLVGNRASLLDKAVARIEDDRALDDEPAPVPGPLQVLVDVGMCGICTFERRLYAGDKQWYPVAPGHEAGGVVSAVGSAVDGLVGSPQLGERAVTVRIGEDRPSQSRLGQI